MLQPKEKGNFETLLLSAHANPNAIYTFVDCSGASVKALYDTDYETDNGLELDDPEYEEYIGIAFKNISTGNLFEICYKNTPQTVFCDNERLFMPA